MPAQTQIYRLPAIFAINEKLNGNSIQQILVPEQAADVVEERYVSDVATGTVITQAYSNNPSLLVITSGVPPADGFDEILRLDHGNEQNGDGARLLKWVRHPALANVPEPPIDYPSRLREVIDSWRDSFNYLEEGVNKQSRGLRSPQIGAVHAVHAHWAITNKIATIVMPTGTGKTETMLSILVSKQCQKLLVVVPTDALRTQLAGKFLALGILKELGAINQSALYPIVGTLKHKPKTIDEVDAYFGKCNVVVTTASIAGACTREVQERIAQFCPFLFIDEAHHVGAPTWYEFRKRFERERILQFTATPYRNDGKPVGGKIIFNYPLRKALEDGYFKPIHFKPVVEFDRRKADKAIAERAIEQLRADLQEYDHILMARVESIDRAHEVHLLYAKYTEFNPVEIHTGLSARDRERIRRLILNKEAKIVVCVDMLGEGFDLPELKIAAFHDIKKSLPITLQITGRFTRAKPQLGEPTFVANIGDVEVQDELRKLYTQDADWSVLLMRSSEEVIEEQVALWEFLEGFRNFPDEIPLQNMRPAMSTVIYKTRCMEWTPENFKQGIPGEESLERIQYDINHQQNTLVIVTARRVPIDWAQIEEIFNWDWELFVLHWDNTQNLLFINSSGNSGHYQLLAEAVAGEVELIKGPPVFRCFAGVNRLRLQNVGLVEQLGRLIRYTMRAGADVEAGLTEAQKRNAVKSNIFGHGYENGRKVSVGCSYKGRIWSQRVANVETLTRWCRFIGHKVLNEEIDPDEVLRGTLTPIPVSQRPHKMPIGIDWPEVIYKESETAYEFMIDRELRLPLYVVELMLCNPAEEGNITFELSSADANVTFNLTLFEKDDIKDYQFTVGLGHTVEIKYGASRVPVEQFFYHNPPTIWFVDGSSLEGNLLTELKRKYPPYPIERIRTWDWTGVNIRKESQGETKEPDSIQYRVIQDLKRENYTVIFDDDASGEAADVVAILTEDKSITVDLFHCKFSLEDEPGARIKDLYEVCGQAQKCVHWMDNPTDLFRHLLRREKRRENMGGSRFERGGQAELLRLTEMSRLLPVNLRIYIVQPGLSKQQASVDQLELLSVTESYLMDTYKLPFFVIASA